MAYLTLQDDVLFPILTPEVLLCNRYPHTHKPRKYGRGNEEVLGPTDLEALKGLIRRKQEATHSSLPFLLPRG